MKIPGQTLSVRQA